MKKLVFLAGFLLATGQIMAQANEKVTIEIGSEGVKVINHKTGDSTFVEAPNRGHEDEPEKDEDKKVKTGISNKANWSSFDFGVGMLYRPDWTNNFNNQPYLDFDPAKSWTFNLNIFEHYFGLLGKEKQNVGIVTGLGFNFSHFGYNNNYTISYDADSISGIVDDTRKYSRNRLRAADLQLPLLMQFNSPSGKDKSGNFHLSAGVVGGIRIGSRLRQRYIENDNEFDIKDKRGDFFFNSFKADATVRVGYGDFGVFASYNLIPLFRTTVVEDVRNVSFGLMMNF